MKDDGTIYVTKFDGSLLKFAVNLLIAVGVDCFFWAGLGDFLSLSVLELFSALCCHGYGTKKMCLHHIQVCLILECFRLGLSEISVLACLLAWNWWAYLSARLRKIGPPAYQPEIVTFCQKAVSKWFHVAIIQCKEF